MSETQINEEVAKPSSPTIERKRTDSESGEPSSPEIHFEPIIELPLIEVKTLEENENELLKLRAKLYRYDTSESPPEFKERGTGEVKILRHNSSQTVRILMRRDKTLKLCANHYILPSMELKKHNNSEKVFVWNTLADLSEDSPKAETLAIRFGNVENAQKFRDVFEEAKKYVNSSQDNDIINHLNKVSLKDDQKDDTNGDREESSSDQSETHEDNRPQNKSNNESDKNQ